MRAFVFTDAALASPAGRFVWLEIDTEKPENAAFLEKFPIDALPTFLVLDPEHERVALRWEGGLTVEQVRDFLAEGQEAIAGRRPPPVALARADELYGQGRNAEAVPAYREALAASPPGGPAYGRAAAALLSALQATGDHARAVGVARETLPGLAGTPSAFLVAVAGLDSALELPADDRGEPLAIFESEVRRLIADPTLGVAADDRSGGYASLVEARKQAKDEGGARRVAEQWASFLEAEAARAKTSEQRAVFDAHRLSAYLELGRAERAIPMLEGSERDLPDDYNPPARLAVAYERLKRWDEALAASERALAKAYGPRRLRVLRVRADIHAGRGDQASARRTLAEAVAFAEALPAGQRSEKTLESLRKRLRSLE